MYDKAYNLLEEVYRKLKETKEENVIEPLY